MLITTSHWSSLESLSFRRPGSYFPLRLLIWHLASTLVPRSANDQSSRQWFDLWSALDLFWTITASRECSGEFSSYFDCIWKSLDWPQCCLSIRVSQPFVNLHQFGYQHSKWLCRCLRLGWALRNPRVGLKDPYFAWNLCRGWLTRFLAWGGEVSAFCRRITAGCAGKCPRNLFRPWFPEWKLGCSRRKARSNTTSLSSRNSPKTQDSSLCYWNLRWRQPSHKLLPALGIQQAVFSSQ